MKRGTRIAALSTAIATVALAGVAIVAIPRMTAHAATLSVCPSSCTYKSINDALAVAAAGDTITVGPGTYGPNEPGATTPDTQIVITKPITLTGAGSGQSIINDAPANMGTATAGVIKVTPATAGNVTISGFTLEGAIVNDSADDGILIVIQDANVASDVITVSNDLFYGDTTLDPQLLQDQTDAIVVQNTGNATTTVSHNTFNGVFRAALIEGNQGPFSFINNDVNLHGQTDTTVTPPFFWAEGLLFLGDNGALITTPQIVSGNTFESYLGMGVGVDAGYTGGQAGGYTNLSITSNTFNNLGVAGKQSVTDDADILMHVFATSNATIASSISGVTIQNNTLTQGSSDGHGYGIRLIGSFGGKNTIDHNVLTGTGATRPVAGIGLTTPASTTGLTITNNIITGYVTGVASDTLPEGAQVSATQNCIMSNTTAGATVATGMALVADHNWWGAASGPLNTISNPSGTGNSVSANVTFSPFLTAPAAVCTPPPAPTSTPPPPGHGLDGKSAPPTPTALPQQPIASGGAPAAPGTSGGSPRGTGGVIATPTPSTSFLIVLIPALVILLGGLAVVGVIYFRRRATGSQG